MLLNRSTNTRTGFRLFFSVFACIAFIIHVHSSTTIPLRYNYELPQVWDQSSSQFPDCCGILGPPAGLLMMILSTERTDTAASVARRIAHDLAARESTMPASLALSVPSCSSCLIIFVQGDFSG